MLASDLDYGDIGCYRALPEYVRSQATDVGYLNECMSGSIRAERSHRICAKDWVSYAQTIEIMLVQDYSHSA